MMGKFKWKHGIMLVVIVVVCMFCFRGFSLAKSGDVEEKKQLCGVYISFASYKEKGEENEKIYAKRTQDSEDGYTFSDLKGYSMFFTKEGEEEESVTSSNVDKAICNVALAVGVVDQDGTSTQENKLSGTLYVTSRFCEIIRFYPVYVEGNGKYYTSLKSSISASKVDGKLSAELKFNTNEAFNTVSGSMNQSKKFECELTIKPVDELKNITVKEYNLKDEVIKEQKIIHTSDEYDMILQSSTAYVIVEETVINAEGKEEVKRTIYDWKDPVSEEDKLSHTCNYANEDGIIIPKQLYFTKEHKNDKQEL